METMEFNLLREPWVRVRTQDGTIKTDEAGTLDFSGVPAFFVTIVLIVQCSATLNVHSFEPYLISSTVAFSSSKVL